MKKFAKQFLDLLLAMTMALGLLSSTAWATNVVDEPTGTQTAPADEQETAPADEAEEQTEADDKTLADMKSGYEKMGIETAVDDYGTGYSNIVNLLRYMPNYVKVDRMLLSGIQDNPQKQHFVKDIVIFAHENHFQVLAEGVETSEELETVIKLGVDLIQGYYTARPNPDILGRIDSNIEEEICRYQKERVS